MPIVTRAIIAVTLVFGTVAFILALLLWKNLKYTTAGVAAIALAVTISAFVIQHAILLLVDPAPHLFELSRTVVLVALIVVIGLVIYSRRDSPEVIDGD